MITTCTIDARCPRHRASSGTPSDLDPCGGLPVPEMRGEDFRRLARAYGEEARDLQEGTAPPDLIHYLAERVQDLASMLCEANARLGRAERERDDLRAKLARVRDAARAIRDAQKRPCYCADNEGHPPEDVPACPQCPALGKAYGALEKAALALLDDAPAATEREG